MIMAVVGEQPIQFEGGAITSPDPVPAAFDRPAMAVIGVETVDDVPVNERRQLQVHRGDPRHFRAVVVKLGGSIIADDGD